MAVCHIIFSVLNRNQLLQSTPYHISFNPAVFPLFCCNVSRKPGIFREAPLASGLVSERGRSLSAGEEGERERGCGAE